MKVAITIPVYVNVLAHRDFLDQATRSFNTSHELIFIPVVNRLNQTFDCHPYKFNQESIKVVELQGRQPQAVSKAWNDGIAKGIEEGCEYIIVLNQDVVISKKAIDKLITFAEANKDNIVVWTMDEHNNLATLDVQTGGADNVGPHFSAFMVHKTFPGIMGKFDENLVPAYFEDNDLIVRVIKLGHRTARCKPAKFFHYGSKTISTDPDLYNTHGPRFLANEAYFIKKWGHRVVNTDGEILNILYKTPFNDPNRGVNSW